MQGVIKSYDPASKVGVVTDDVTRAEHELAPDALEGSIFRMVRQGQRVIYDLDGRGLATRLRLGSEVDLGTPDWITAGGRLRDLRPGQTCRPKSELSVTLCASTRIRHVALRRETRTRRTSCLPPLTAS